MDTRRRQSIPHHKQFKSHVPPKYSSVLNITRRTKTHLSDLNNQKDNGVNADHATNQRKQVSNVHPTKTVNNEIRKEIPEATCIANRGHHCKPCHFRFHFPNFLKLYPHHHHHHSEQHTKMDNKDAKRRDTLEETHTELFEPYKSDNLKEVSIPGIDNDTLGFEEETSSTIRNDAEILKASVIFDNESEVNIENDFNLHVIYETLYHDKQQRMRTISENVAMISVSTQTHDNEIIKDQGNNCSIAQRRQLFDNYVFKQELITDTMHLRQKGLLEHWMRQQLSLCEEEDETSDGEF